MAPPPDAESALVTGLRNALNESGLSQNQLARVIGVSQGQLSRFMRGERLLSLTAAGKVFDYFGMTLTRPDPPAESDPPRRRSGKK